MVHSFASFVIRLAAAEARLAAVPTAILAEQVGRHAELADEVEARLTVLERAIEADWPGLLRARERASSS
jgi:hypothetical protein